jgi:hypothetical protein
MPPALLMYVWPAQRAAACRKLDARLTLPMADPTTSCPTPVHRLVPFAYVQDVTETLAFYTLLGFHAKHIMHAPDGRAVWAWAETREVVAGRGPAQIMFSRSGAPIKPTVQDIFFYMHCPDVRALRAHLVTTGLVDAGPFVSRQGPFDRRGVVFDITHPQHMPEGEFRVHDPDGYAIHIGQSDWKSTLTG